jgi:NitT/TauT family transport system permease protein
MLMKKRKLKWIVITAFWLLVWQIVYLLVNEPLFLTGPVETAESLIRLLGQGSTYGILLQTTAKIMGGFLLALALALVTAFLAWRIPVVREGLTPMLSFAKSVPIASVIILLLAWFSSSRIAAFVAGFVAFPILYFEMLSAFDNLDAEILEMLQVYRVPFGRRLRYVYLPAVCDRLEASLRIAVGMCIRAGVAAELIGVPAHSVGEKLYKAKLYLEMSDLFAWTVIIVVTGYVWEKIMIGIVKAIGRRVGGNYD